MCTKTLCVVLSAALLLAAMGCHSFRLLSRGNEHLEEGLRLYDDEDFGAAIVELSQAQDIFEGLVAVDIGEKRLSDIYAYLASCYYELVDYDVALEYLTLARDIYQKYDETQRIAENLQMTAGIYAKQGLIQMSLDCCDRALELYYRSSDSRQNRKYISRALILRGEGFFTRGRYDQALKDFEGAVELGEDDSEELPYAVSNMGSVYEAWGQYDVALEYYEKALSLSVAMNQKEMVPYYLSLIAAAYLLVGEYEESLRHYNDALRLIVGVNVIYLEILHGLSETYTKMGNIPRAAEYLEKLVEMCENLDEATMIRLGTRLKLGTYLLALGRAYRELNKDEEALEIFDRIADGYVYDDKNLSMQERIDRALLFWKQGKYNETIYQADDAITTIEEIRKSAPGLAKRDYLAAQMDAYRLIVASNVRLGQPYEALTAVQQASTRYLSETILDKLTDDEGRKEFDNIWDQDSARGLQAKLHNRSAVVVFANVDCPFSPPVGILITRTAVRVTELDRKRFVAYVESTVRESLGSAIQKMKSLKISEQKSSNTFIAPENDQVNTFCRIVDYYRYLLTTTGIVDRGIEIEADDYATQIQRERDTGYRDLIASQLYRLLLEPFACELELITELVVVPDSVLAFIPFETLLDRDGNRLVQDYLIKYQQSLVLMNLLANRRYDNSGKKPLVAFGGAVYNRVPTDKRIGISDAEIAYVLEGEGRENIDIYQRMGVSFSDIPGTLKEVKSIEKLMTGGTVYTEETVTEELVKELSRSGDLKVYRVLHFATHGLTVPDYPELSCLVLSQHKERRGSEDGYLQAAEIGSLEIEADFVNLSACETGLGRVYAGEGVVGVAQAFLLAGANRLCVSLWCVADESTAEFMSGMYRHVIKNEESYAEALRAMKLQFLESDEYSSPFYWAPFVYYGN